MASTYTTNKSLETPAIGDPNWGGPLNSDFGIIDKALGSVTTITLGSTTPVVITNVQYQNMGIVLSGVLSANIVCQIPSGVGGFWIVRTTATMGDYTITFASAGGGTSVVLEANTIMSIYSDGTNIRASNVFGGSNQVPFNASGLKMDGSDRFTYTISKSSISSRAQLNISSGTWSTGTKKATFVLGSAFPDDLTGLAGEYVTINGVEPVGYRGVWLVDSASGTSLVVSMPDDPGAAATTAGGTVVYGSIRAGSMMIGNVAVTATGGQINAAGQDGKSFVSSTATFTSSVLKTYAHGLGDRPKFIQIFLECVTADAGYSVGDIIYPCQNSSTSSNDRFNAIYADATNAYVRLSNSAQCFVYGNKTTGAITALTNANWKIGVSAHL